MHKRKTSMTWEPLAESNRRPSPYRSHGPPPSAHQPHRLHARMHRKHPVRTAPGPRHTGPPGHRVTLSDRHVMTAPPRGHALRLADATLRTGQPSLSSTLSTTTARSPPAKPASAGDSARTRPAGRRDRHQPRARAPHGPRPLTEDPQAP